MADLSDVREKLLQAATAKLGSGIRRYQVGDRLFEYHSPKELVDALLALGAAGAGTGASAPGAGSSTCFLEVEGAC